MIWGLLHTIFAWVCGVFLFLFILAWMPVGFLNRSKHDPTCCCDYCDPDHRKSRRLGIRHH